MVAVSRLIVPGPPPKDVWGTFGLSVLLHLLLVALAIAIPRLQVGRYITVPVIYTVNLVSAPPGGASAAPAKAAAPAPAPAATASPAPAAPSAAPPRPAPRPTEELTLPGRRPAKTVPSKDDPSLRPPSLAGRQVPPQPPRPIPTPPGPVVPVPAPQAPPAAVPGPPAAVASVTPGPPAKGSGVELAGPGVGAGGGTALAQYLTLVDWKIQGNWVPVASTGEPEAVVIIRFRVLRSGQVKDLALETSSGSASMDNAALRAVRQSLPFPPFPNLLTDPLLDLRYRFVMERG